MATIQTAQTTGLYSKVHSGNHTDCTNNRSLFQGAQWQPYRLHKQQVSIPRCTVATIQTAQITGLYSKVHSGNHTDCTNNRSLFQGAQWQPYRLHKQQVSIPRCTIDSHAACKQQVSIPRCTVDSHADCTNNRSLF